MAVKSWEVGGEGLAKASPAHPGSGTSTYPPVLPVVSRRCHDGIAQLGTLSSFQTQSSWIGGTPKQGQPLPRDFPYSSSPLLQA